jgi:replicative DNA helicase
MSAAYSPDALPFRVVADNRLLNIEAERALLGALLAKPSLLASLPGSFRSAHYGYDGHAEIHEAIIAVGQPGAPAMIAVKQAIAQDDHEKTKYLANLLTCFVGLQPGYAANLCNLITDLHRRREVVALTEHMREQAYASSAGEASADAIIGASMARLDALALSMPASQGMSMDAAMDAALRAADEATARDGPAGLSTGMPSVDDKTGGLEPGTLTVLAGRPGMGKSALGWQWAVNAARAGIGVVVISLEMSALELGRRALATLSGVEVWRMKRGKLLPGQRELLIDARRELASLKLTIEDGGGLTAAGISLKIRNARRKHGVGLVMVDHLHIIRPEDEDARHGGTWAVGRISGAMKRLAKEHQCPVLLLAQLNRGVENRDDKRPNLSDLRQSGDIEQDADAVAFVYRAEYYMAKEPEQSPGETMEKFANRKTQWQTARDAAAGRAELIFAKVRDGEPGTVDLNFCGATTSFSERDHGRY